MDGRAESESMQETYRSKNEATDTCMRERTYRESNDKSHVDDSDRAHRNHTYIN